VPALGDNQMKSRDGIPVVFPTGGGLGAEIRGVDLPRLGDNAFAAIHRAWLDHLVLLFRRQELTDAELIAFSRRFGELDLAAPSPGSGARICDALRIYRKQQLQEQLTQLPSRPRLHSKLPACLWRKKI
jgi:alpha-ketoglutarate-dependent taurine dioxygenase